ncbi:hypothetical protein [Bacillus sp. B1-b2]|uniref:hypothetical protein n=1 Tax=Bacillus sp. B1-b2 TaxID=2653201 RepID=UPI00126164EB|nr:hypothetical protein [Bacillus sp. B1-b2]KAB7669329.1 hypothetical protein F9279_10900 [Bacillus sp. B1-b2]
MKGTAILILSDLSIKVIEHIDITNWNNLSDDNIFHQKQVLSEDEKIYLLAEEIDWEYGY